MDLRQLHALVAVADHGSFSAAARALHTVQSNVSTHVARLEREIGATLIDRASGTLTPEGELVVTRARRIHAELDALAADLASLHDEIAGRVRMGSIGTTARWLLPPLMAEMSQRHPRVRVVVIDATTSSLLPQLGEGDLDLAVVNLPVVDPDILTEPLFEEDHLLLTPQGHPLHDRARIDFGELDGIPLLLEPQGTGFRDHLDAQATRLGISLVPQAEVDGMRLLASLAYQGFGAALVPASAAPVWLTGGWHTAPVDGLQRRTVGLATRRRGLPSAPARALREALLAVIAAVGANQRGIHPLPTVGTARDTG
ncbi:MAG: LysR family transcriptional regulator [Acidimicrobiales bacterium]|jgi:LysR family hydrogen peroxide-inducible transcriptional activator|nr:LysR family transcriptional regulator [Acidimicrobiales bacterium]